MDLFVQQLTNGVVVGSVYALIAIGFTLTFGVLRVLNMAHGEFYMLGAFLAYWALDTLGVPLWAAVPVALAGVFAAGFAVERVALRPLRHAPHFIPLVSTIAVGTVMVECVRLAFGPYTFSFDTDLSNESIVLGPLQMSPLQIFVLGLSLALTVAVQLFLTRSKWGRAIRGTAGDPVVSQLLGIDSDRVIGLTFAVASALGGVAGILIAMYFGAIYPSMGFVALIKAFTAAILGGMGSVPGAVLGGFCLGIVESMGSAYLPSGVSDALPFVLLFVGLLVLPGGLTRQRPVDAGQGAAVQAGSGLLDRLLPRRSAPGRDIGVALAVVVGLLACAVAPLLSDYVLRVLVVVAVTSAMALGTNVILGLAGQLSLCHAAFYAIGAYASALLTTRFGFGFLGAMATGAVLAALLGGLLSLTTFRVRGYYLALITLAFAEIVRIVVGHWTSLTGGMMGLRGIPAPRLGPWTVETPLGYFYLAMGFCAVAFAAYDAIAFSTQGRAMLAIRDDELAARASGLPVLRLKVAAFMLSAVFPAMGGSLMAHYFSAITPDFASLGETVGILVVVVIGGLGSAAGAVFGAGVVNLFPEVFRSLGDYRLLIYGLVLLIMVLYQPAGTFSIVRRLARRP